MTRCEIVEHDGRISLVADGIELCGARQPHGHNGTWLVYATSRLTLHMHQLVAYTRGAVMAHLEMIGELYDKANDTAGVR